MSAFEFGGNKNAIYNEHLTHKEVEIMTEAQIEEILIEKLKDLKYKYRSDIRDRNALEQNFRTKFEALNKVHLTDSEFNRLLKSIISPDVFDSSKRLRSRETLIREDGTPLQYSLVNIKDWCKNDYEVINQLRMNTGKSNHRYDVILLINGIPVVQIELKTLGINTHRAIQQIVEYKSDPGNGYTNSLLCFMQLFIVSNRINTYYFANNNSKHFGFNADEKYLPIYQFAAEDNSKITLLDEFVEKFLPKCTLGEMINKYLVLVASEQKIIVMRPYQIYAVKAIVDCIHENRGNGYIWHTTGSGKTLTSFKASTLLKDNPDIEKCLFIVDRKDLDRQTREEFNKFQEGCVEENTNTYSLVKRLLSNDYADKVIVSTIQKLGLALDENSKRNQESKQKGKQSYREQLESLRDKRMVIIFDECHRSQFGDNHKAIKEFFPNAQLFGFTGTPIFEDNASAVQMIGENASYITTQDIFQKQLHSYTITNAIDDNNVLRFHIDYYEPKLNTNDKKPDEAVARQAIAEDILNKHYSATASRRYNAIFATASIDNAIEYYHIFKKLQDKRLAEDSEYQLLNIACVFSPPVMALANDDDNTNAKNIADIKQLQEDLSQEKEDNKQFPEAKKEALKGIIADYNDKYGTNYSIAEFDFYYQGVQQRIKDQKYSNADLPQSKKIDIVIVVDMLLTGFDSKYLNTLYVDKNLKYHGLIQAFSRTNRILNSNKNFGNIIDYRGQQSEVEQAIALFSGLNSERAKEIWLVDPAPVVIKKFQQATAELEIFMKSNGLECRPEEVSNLKGDLARSEFINRFKEVQKLRNQLDQYTDLTIEQSDTIDELIPEDEFRSFRGVYLDTAKRLKAIQDKGENTPPEVQQLDFEFVLFATDLIDYDYIIRLIAKYTQDNKSKQKMTVEQLISLIASNSKWMNERKDIEEYIRSLELGKALDEKEIREGYRKFKAEKFDKELSEIAQKHELNAESLKQFTERIMNRMIFDGEELTDLLEPLELGWRERTAKELTLMADLQPLLKQQAQGQEISGLNAYEQK